ncbi:MAG: hypothetical protein ACR2NL_04975, partial [Acidimicrobiia bacterium]
MARVDQVDPPFGEIRTRTLVDADPDTLRRHTKNSDADSASSRLALRSAAKPSIVPPSDPILRQLP